MTPAAVTVTQAPDVDCVGSWGTCSKTSRRLGVETYVSCTKTYEISTAQSGTGTSCPTDHYETAVCPMGPTGACPAETPSKASDAAATAASMALVVAAAATIAAAL